MGCNEKRFTERVFSDEGLERSLCRCCGKYIAAPDEYRLYPSGNTIDGICRWCERGHPRMPKIERPRLFA